jgi:hypothetical protein
MGAAWLVLPCALNNQAKEQDTVGDSVVWLQEKRLL